MAESKDPFLVDRQLKLGRQVRNYRYFLVTKFMSERNFGAKEASETAASTCRYSVMCGRVCG